MTGYSTVMMRRNVLDETIDIDSAVTDLVRAINAISEDSKLWLSSHGSALRPTDGSISVSGPPQDDALTPNERGSSEAPAGTAEPERTLRRKLLGDLSAACLVVISIFILMAVLG